MAIPLLRHELTHQMVPILLIQSQTALHSTARPEGYLKI